MRTAAAIIAAVLAAMQLYGALTAGKAAVSAANARAVAIEAAVGR